MKYKGQSLKGCWCRPGQEVLSFQNAWSGALGRGQVSRVGDLVGLEEAWLQLRTGSSSGRSWQATYPSLCHCTPRVGSLVKWRRTLATSYRLAHQSQLEGNQTSRDLRLGLAFLLLEGTPAPAHQPACPRQGHTDSFPFQTGKPPPGIAGRRQPATLPGLDLGLRFKVCMFTGLGRQRCISPELPTPQSTGQVLRPHQTDGVLYEDYNSVNRHFLEVADA